MQNIQSTNWQTLRFKPPPAGSSIGWRVEFRPMEVQLTDFENAAFAVFIVLLSRTILHFNLNLYIPISKVRALLYAVTLDSRRRQVDENMARAQRRDAVRSQKFYFRKEVFPSASSQPSSLASSTPGSPVSEHGSPILVNGINGKERKLRNCFPLLPMPDDAIVPDMLADEYEEMTMEEIMNGKVRPRSQFFPSIASVGISSLLQPNLFSRLLHSQEAVSACEIWLTLHPS